MEIIKEVLLELFSMFVTDMRLTLTTLGLVVLVAILMSLHAGPILGGAVLLLGCFAIIIEATVRETKIRGNKR